MPAQYRVSLFQFIHCQLSPDFGAVLNNDRYNMNGILYNIAHTDIGYFKNT